MMYDKMCKCTANFISQIVHWWVVLLIIVFITLSVHKYAVKGKLYIILKESRIRNLYHSTIIGALLNEKLVVLELIFIRNDSFDISGNGAPLYSCDNIILFISLICTSDVWFSPVYYTFVCEINTNNHNWECTIIHYKTIFNVVLLLLKSRVWR